MSWPQWSQPAAAAVPGWTGTSIAAPAPAVGALQTPGTPYTAEQWAAMQQQNWQQWVQWQQQYQQWQQQYGEQYQKSLALAGQTPAAVSLMPVQPPLPASDNKSVLASLTDTRPPLPPEEPPRNVSVAMPLTPANFNASVPPPNMTSLPPAQLPPPQPKPPLLEQGPQQQIGPNQNYTSNRYNSNNPPPSLLSLSVSKPAVFVDNQQQHRNRSFSNKRSGDFHSDNIDDAKKNRWEDNLDEKHGPKQWNSNQPTQRNQQWTANKSVSQRPKVEELSEAEKNFDKQFEQWEAQFNKWKEQNAGHPDKQQYKEYEAKWESWRTQLLDRREQMRRKRLGLLGSPVQPTTSKPIVSGASHTGITNPGIDMNQPLSFKEKSETNNKKEFPKPPVKPTVEEESREDIIENKEEAIPLDSNISVLLSQPPKEQRVNIRQRRASVKSDSDNNVDTSFLKANESEGGIPGLDLVENDDSKLPDNKEMNSKLPDYEAISKGINSILGDEKLLNMLSMVAQNKKIESSDVDKNSSRQPGSSDLNNQAQNKFNEMAPNRDNFGQPGQEFNASGLQNRNSSNLMQNKGPQGDFNPELQNSFNRDYNEFEQMHPGRGPSFNKGRDFEQGHKFPDNFNQGSFNRGPNNFNQGPSNRGQDDFNEGPSGRRQREFGRGPPNRGPGDFSQGPPNRGPGDFTQGPPNRGPGDFTQGPPNRGPDDFAQAPPNRGPGDFAQGPPNRGPGDFTQGPPKRALLGDFSQLPPNRGPDDFTQLPPRGPDDFTPGPPNRGSADFSQGPLNKGPSDLAHGLANREPNDFNQGPPNRGPGPPNRRPDDFIPGPPNRGGPGNFLPNRGPGDFNQGSSNIHSGGPRFRGPGGFNQGQRNKGLNNFERDFQNQNRSGNFNQNFQNSGSGDFNRNSGPENYDRDPQNIEPEDMNRPPQHRGFGDFNQGPSNNFNRNLNDSIPRPARGTNNDFNQEQDTGPNNFNQGSLNRRSGDFNQNPNRASFDFNQMGTGRGRGGFNQGRPNKGPGNFNQEPLIRDHGTKNYGPFGGPIDRDSRDNIPETGDFNSPPNRGPLNKQSGDFNQGPMNRGPNDYRNRRNSNRGPDNFNQGPPPRGGPNFSHQGPSNRGPNDFHQRFPNRGGNDINNFNRNPNWDPSDPDLDNQNRIPLNPNDEISGEELGQWNPNSGEMEGQNRPEDLENSNQDSLGKNNQSQPGIFNEDQTFRGSSDRYWDEALILKPVTVIDYGHKSLNKSDTTFMEPVQTFDYGHTSKNVDKKMPELRPPRDLPPKFQRFTDKFSKFNPSHPPKLPPPSKFGNRDDFHRNSYNKRPSHDNFERDREIFSKDVSFEELSFENQKDQFEDVDDFEDDPFEEPEFNRASNERELEPFLNKPNPDFDGDSQLTKSKEKSVIMIEDLLTPPGRNTRPPRIAIILRGPPGSGKTFLAKLIKDKEVEQGGSPPRILSLDDYFMVEQDKEVFDAETGRKTTVKEMVYEYEECMELAYRQSLEKAFKKTITDGFFPFIILDCINDKTKHFSDMWSFAKQNGFQVYICQMELDVTACTKRNIHHRSEIEIERLVAGWETTPSHFLTLDATSLIQSGCISEVEMEEVIEIDDDENDDDDIKGHVISKWERMEHSGEKLARLDGTSKPLRPRATMEDYLQMDEDIPKEDKPGVKRVRWADLEERRRQDKMRAIGFVVGQTDWDRMMDPTQGGSALTQTKYIERVRRF